MPEVTKLGGADVGLDPGQTGSGLVIAKQWMGSQTMKSGASTEEGPEKASQAFPCGMNSLDE